MQFGLIHYRAPGDTLEQFLDYAADTGFDSVELFGSDIWHENVDSPEREAERVRRLLDQRGIVASALGTGNDFVVLEETAIQAQIERMDRLSSLATIIGAKVLRTEGGSRKEQVPKEKEAQAIAGCLQRCLEFVERDDTYLAVDNHGYVTNDPAVLLGALRAVDSPHAGANLDTANIHWAGNDLTTCQRFYDDVAPYVRHTHIKDCTGCAPDSTYQSTVAGEGDVDLIHAIRSLQRAGYQGVFTAEWEGKGDGGQAYAKCLDWMRMNIKDE